MVIQFSRMCLHALKHSVTLWLYECPREIYELNIKVYALKLITSDDAEVICISNDGAAIANANVRITFHFFPHFASCAVNHS
jgi:hypothetical protein